jgi:phosphoribosylanthranilate isomerase
MRVKICGIKNSIDLSIALKAGADAVGFITDVPVETPRKLSLEDASGLISEVPVFVTSVLVIMPQDAEEAIRMIGASGPAAVQIHNELPVSELYRIRETGVKIIKTIPIAEGADPEILIEQIKRLEGVADAVLLDTALDGKTGGTGVPHNWEVSSRIVLSTKLPVILGGGLNPENVGKAVRSVRPYAVDVASGVEKGGKKNERKVIDFINNARKHEI